MDRLLVVTTLLSLALIVLVLTSLRRAHIRVEYSVSWLAAAVILLLLSRVKGAIEWIGGWIGVGDAPVALLFIVTGVFLLVFFRFSLIISDLKDANIALTQKVGILEYRIESMPDGRK